VVSITNSALEPECKKYRYIADLVNDSALVFDCLSPLYPGSQNTKIFLLCMSGLLRSICGVMAGGSRAALTQHFTDPVRGSIADVNAKDQSQETVITLVGMLAGSVLVKMVQGDGIEMWITVILLLSLHLFTNYKAVSSVIIRTLNRQRTNIVFSDIIRSLPEIEQAVDSTVEDVQKSVSKLLYTPRKASNRERILEPDGLLRWYSSSGDQVVGHAEFTGFQSILSILPASVSLDHLIDASQATVSGYLIFYSVRQHRPELKICLLNSRNKSCDVRAWVHALLIAQNLVNSPQLQTDPLHVIRETGRIVDRLFVELNIEPALASAGWDLDRYAVRSKPNPTVQIELYATKR
jgi:hypothetical protein